MSSIKMQNTKIINAYTAISENVCGVNINGDPFQIVTGTEQRDKSTEEKTHTVATIMSYGYLDSEIDDQERSCVQMQTKLTWLDRCIMDVIYTIFLSRKPVPSDGTLITYNEIYKGVMNVTGYVSKKSIIKIKQSIYKMNMIWVTLNVTNDFPKVMKYFENNHNETYNAYELKERMLECGFNKRTYRNGAKAEGVIIKDIPILLKYAEATGQILTIPTNMLNIPGMYLTEENIAIRGYLISYIYARRAKRLHNEVLTYKTIFDKAGIEIDGKENIMKQKRKRLKECVHNILNYYKECGIISEWDIKEKYNSISISLNEGKTIV